MTFYLTPFLTYRAVGYWSNYRFLQRVRVARNAYRMYCYSYTIYVRHFPILCADKWRYDRAVFSIW